MALATRKIHGFDYSKLRTDSRLIVRQATQEIRDRIAASAQKIFEIGERLIEVKKHLKHGEWLNWLMGEFEWGEDTARRMMSVAEKFKSRNLRDLSIAPSAIYLLSAPTTPDAVVEESMTRASRGEKVTHAQVKAAIAKEKPAAVTREELAKLAGVSLDTVAKVERTMERGIPELHQAAREGKISVDEAAKVADLPRAEQSKAAEKGVEGFKAAAKLTFRPAPPEDEEVWPEDCVGTPLPDRENIRMAFVNAHKFDQMLASLTEITRILNALYGPPGKPAFGAEWIIVHNTRRYITDAIDVLKDNIKNNKPYAVCPYCKGDDAKCEACKGRGWVTKETYESAPRELKPRG